MRTLINFVFNTVIINMPAQRLDFKFYITKELQAIDLANTDAAPMFV